MMGLLLCCCMSGCSPDFRDYLSTKKITDEQIPQEPAPVLSHVIQPEPLADPEIAPSATVLRVGYSHDVPPYIYKKNKKIQGIEEDLAQQFGQFAGKEVQFVKVPEKRATEALEKGLIDIILPGRKIIKRNNAPVTFSDPYLRAGQILLVRSQDLAIFSNGIYSLDGSGFTFGVIKASSGEQFMTKSIKNVKIIPFETVEAAIMALKTKHIDLFLHDAPTICHFAAVNKAAGLTPILNLVTEEYIGWEMRTEDTELQHQANLFIQQSKADGRLQKTIKHWIPNL